MAVSVIGATGWAMGALEPGLPPLPSPWESLFEVRAGAGYNDNVTLAHSNPEQAPLISTALDAVISRLPLDGTQLNFTLTADDSRFLGSGPVDHETLVLAQAEGKRFLPNGWQPSVGLQYFYQDQVLDVSTTETNQEALLVRGQTVTARPGVRLDLNPRWWIALETPADYQFFAAPLDDYWEAGGGASAGFIYGRKSEFTVTYAADHRAYQSDPALDAEGEPIAGVTKAFWQQNVRLTWRHYWDEPRLWRTTAKLGYRANRDNASGYFNFNRYNGAGQVRYRAGAWEVTAEAGVYYYHYPVQTVSGPGSPNRERTEVTAGLRAERQIAKAWRLFAEYGYERVLGNITSEEYAVNQGKAGVSWEF